MKNINHKLSQKNPLAIARIAAYLSFTAAIAITAPLTLAAETGEQAQRSVSVDLGALGAGISYSQKAKFSLKEGDQVQWRLAISGINTTVDDEDIDINGTDYKDLDVSLASIKGGADWYPYNSGWAKQVFFSGGLMYNDLSLQGTANNTKNFSVGGTVVTPGDINSLTTDIDDAQVMPYLSLGWGNKLRNDKGFGFMAEAGVAMATEDVDVTVTADDPNNFLNAALLRTEEQEIQDDLDDARAFVMISAVYHF